MDHDGRREAMEDARQECRRLLDQEGRRLGRGDGTADRFTVEAFWSREMRVNFWRDPSPIERQACRIESGPLRWNGGLGHADAITEHVERMMRMDQRMAAGLRTWESRGDPVWSMTIHRVVVGMLGHAAIEVHDLRAWTDIGDGVSAKRGMSMDHVVVDAGRIHPLGLGFAPRGGVEIRLTATILANDVRTCVMLPGIRWPVAIMEGAAGRRLGEVLEAPGLDASCIVRSIEHDDAWGTRIVLEHDDVALAEAPEGMTTPWMRSPAGDRARRAA